MANREQEIFSNAAELPAGERAAFLTAACGEDTALRTRIEALLGAAERSGGFLGSDEAEIGEGVGDWIGPYRLLERIGDGGFGVVYRAGQETPVRREVALKIVKLGMDTRAVVARFEAERQALALMDHPHIARVFDGGATAAGRPYFVMELVVGRPVTEFCREAKLTVPERLGIILQVCRAVHHAHQKGVIHRDLKPSNILISLSDGRPHAKVIDFGIAKATLEPLTAHTMQSRLQRFIGTPAYMSPEQIALGGVDVDTRSDVFALGAVLHELLVGLPPLDPRTLAGLGYADIERRVREAVFTAPSRSFAALAIEERRCLAAERGTTPAQLLALLRGDLDQILLKSIAGDRVQRYGGAEEFASDLERYLRDEPVRARPATLRYRAGKFMLRHTRAVVVAAAAAITLSGLVAYYTQRLAMARDRAQLAAARAARVSELLTEVLTAPDPFRTPMKGDPLAGLFASTIEQAKKELVDEPALRAQILTAAGRVYLRLGRHQEARDTLSEAIASAREAGSQDVNLVRGLSQMGVLAREQGDFGVAVDCFEEAIKLQQRIPGGEPNELAIALVELGRTYSDQEQYESAERVFREALDIRRRALGEEHRETAVSYGDLGKVLWYQGRLAEAEPVIARGVELNRRTLDGDHPNIAISMANHAQLKRDRGELSAADTLYAEALPMILRTLGPHHWRTARLMSSVASLRTEQGRLDEAMSLLQEAMAVARENSGGERGLKAALQVEIARVHLARDEAAQAEPLLRGALATIQQMFPAGGWRVSAVKSLLGDALTGLERFEEAEALLIEAREGIPQRAGPCGAEHGPTRRRLVRLYERWGKPTLAARHAGS